MPGRVLGGGPPSKYDPHTSPNATPHSPSRVIGKVGGDNSAAEAGRRSLDDVRSPGASPAVEAASLRRERDASERSAWAKRKGIGRTTTSLVGGSLSKRSEAAGDRAIARRRGGRDTRGRGRDEGAPASRGRARSADEHGANEKNEQTAGDDPVTRAFHRYAMDRSHDHHEALLRRSPRPRRDETATSSLSPVHRAALRTDFLSAHGPAPRRNADTIAGRGRSFDRHRQLLPHYGRNKEGGHDDIADLEESPAEESLGSSRDEGRVSFRRRQSRGPGFENRLPAGPEGLGSDRRQSVARVTSGDEGGGRDRRLHPRRDRKLEISRARSSRAWDDLGERGEEERERGARVRVGEGDWGGVSDPEKERVLRRAFDMYDLNGDGYITYLEVRGYYTLARSWLYARVFPHRWSGFPLSGKYLVGLVDFPMFLLTPLQLQGGVYMRSRSRPRIPGTKSVHNFKLLGRHFTHLKQRYSSVRTCSRNIVRAPRA